MSCVFVLELALVAAWPALAAEIEGAADSLGYTPVGEQPVLGKPKDVQIEVSIEGSDVIAESMPRESEFVVTKDDVTATFVRRADGRALVRVTGKNKAEHELEAAAKELIGRVAQQYAYKKVVSQLKNQGFTVTEEQVASDRSIRIRVSKYV